MNELKTGLGHQFRARQKKYEHIQKNLERVVLGLMTAQDLNLKDPDDKIIWDYLQYAILHASQTAEHERERYENND